MGSGSDGHRGLDGSKATRRLFCSYTRDGESVGIVAGRDVRAECEEYVSQQQQKSICDVT